jgi:hypothetical protein
MPDVPPPEGAKQSTASAPHPEAGTSEGEAGPPSEEAAAAPGAEAKPAGRTPLPPQVTLNIAFCPGDGLWGDWTCWNVCELVS